MRISLIFTCLIVMVVSKGKKMLITTHSGMTEGMKIWERDEY